MDTEKSPDQQEGKTVFQKYSRWKKGQHMTTVLQMVPGQEKKILIGRIYFERNGDEKTYVAEGANGKVLGVSKSYVDIEKRFTEHGPALAKAEIENESPIQQEQVPSPAHQTPAEEIAEVRDRADKSKDQSRTR